MFQSITAINLAWTDAAREASAAARNAGAKADAASAKAKADGLQSSHEDASAAHADAMEKYSQAYAHNRPDISDEESYHRNESRRHAEIAKSLAAKPSGIVKTGTLVKQAKGGLAEKAKTIEEHKSASAYHDEQALRSGFGNIKGKIAHENASQLHATAANRLKSAKTIAEKTNAVLTSKAASNASKAAHAIDKF